LVCAPEEAPPTLKFQLGDQPIGGPKLAARCH